MWWDWRGVFLLTGISVVSELSSPFSPFLSLLSKLQLLRQDWCEPNTALHLMWFPPRWERNKRQWFMGAPQKSWRDRKMSTSDMRWTQTLGLFKCVIACVRAITARFCVCVCACAPGYLCADELKMNIMIYDILYLSLASPHISTTLI